MRPILDVSIKMAGVVGCLQRRRAHVSVREREFVCVCDCMVAGTMWRDTWVYVSVGGQEYGGTGQGCP